jgi:hypothetical protein
MASPTTETDLGYTGDEFRFGNLEFVVPLNR